MNIQTVTAIGRCSELFTIYRRSQALATTARLAYATLPGAPGEVLEFLELDYLRNDDEVVNQTRRGRN
jgi:hypothetical protein